MISIDLFNKKIKYLNSGIIGSYNYYHDRKHFHEYNVMEEGTLPILKILDNNNYNNQILLDIGACTGSYCFLVLLLKNFKSHAFEPAESTYNILNMNIKLNNCNNKIISYNIGIGDKYQKKNLHLNKMYAGIATFGDNKKYFRPKNLVNTITQECQIKRLDDIYSNTTDIISYIKIDTEGFDLFVLKGSLNIIDKFRPVIQMEWNKNNMNQNNINFKEIIKLIKNINYYPLFILGEELFLIPEEKKDLFIHLKIKLHPSYQNNTFYNWIEQFNN